MITLRDMEILEKQHAEAAAKVRDFCVSVIDMMRPGDRLTDAQFAEYEKLKKVCLDKKAELARVMDSEFEDVLYGGGR